MTTFRTPHGHLDSGSISRRSARISHSAMIVCAMFSISLAALCSSDAVNGASRGATHRADAQLSELLVGTWKTESWGDQVLTNNADGTASLDVELNRLAAIRYGRELDLELEWTIENRILSHTLVGGSPQRKVDRLIRDFGISTEYRVVEITDSEFVLQELDDPDERHTWELVEDDNA